MREVYPRPAKYKLYNRNSLIRNFSSLEEVLARYSANWIYANLANIKPTKQGWQWNGTFYLTDIYDNVVPRNYLALFLPKQSQNYRYRKPWTLSGGKPRNSHSRRKKIVRELRSYNDEEYGSLDRIKRKGELRRVRAYDWCGRRNRSRHGNYNWKEYRKTQWKDGEIPLTRRLSGQKLRWLRKTLICSDISYYE
jgi:hypothetical protein